MRHTDYEVKRGDGIDFFMLGSNPLHDFIELQVWRVDGSKVPFNPDECIAGKPKKDNRLIEAMRESIEWQINHFRCLNPQPIACPNCNCPSPVFHVDHIKPFKGIAKSFIESFGVVDSFTQLDNYKWTFSDDVIEYSNATHLKALSS